VLTVPDDWSLLPPGDAALSRRIKQDGPTWTVIEKVGNKRFSRGIWAPTARIPIEERAEAATIAWMRHQTTGYDHMTIARVKGERREVRRELARQSVRLLERYRSGMDIDPVHCPLQRALKSRRAE